MLRLRGDPQLANTFAYDEMLRGPVLLDPIPNAKLAGSGRPHLVRDPDIAALQEKLQVAGIEKLGKNTTRQAADLRHRR